MNDTCPEKDKFGYCSISGPTPMSVPCFISHVNCDRYSRFKEKDE